jgi:hypothetical protein
LQEESAEVEKIARFAGTGIQAVAIGGVRKP